MSDFFSGAVIVLSKQELLFENIWEFLSFKLDEFLTGQFRQEGSGDETGRHAAGHLGQRKFMHKLRNTSFPATGKETGFPNSPPPQIYDVPQTEKGWAMFLRRRLERK